MTKNQPCPDCGTLMTPIVIWEGPHFENAWKCPHDGQIWNDEQIALVYHLNGIRDEKEAGNERHTTRDNQS